MIDLVVLTVFIVGILLLYRGLRGTPDFGEPRCRQCGYDVRMIDWTSDTRICPECGSDLTKPQTVRFDKRRRRPKLIWAGAILCLLPSIGFVALHSIMGGRWQLPESNAKIIANLKTSAGTPWDWRKLEDRYKAGDLSHEEVVAAVDELIAHLKAGTGFNGPLTWSDDFLQLALSGGHVDDDQYIRLCKAFYGEHPEVRMRSRIAPGQPLEIGIRPNNAWDLPGVQQVLALRELTVDGQVVTPTARIRGEAGVNAFSAGKHGSFNPVLEEGLSPGTHELTFVYDWGLIVANAPMDPRFSNRPGQKEHWPKPIITWESTERRVVEVVPFDEAVIGLVTDANRDPSGAISIGRIQVFPFGDKLRVETKIKCAAVDVGVCMRVAVRVGDREVTLGHLCGSEPGRACVSKQQGNLEGGLPKDLTHATVILTPDTDLAQERSVANEIWGEPIIIRDVPLERFDISEQEPDAAARADQP